MSIPCRPLLSVRVDSVLVFRYEVTSARLHLEDGTIEGQLKLYHTGREQNNCCQQTSRCVATKETIRHLLWDCPSARTLRDKVVSHWTGEYATRQRTEHFMPACASRKINSIPQHRQAVIEDRFQDDSTLAKSEWKRVWHIITTICLTRLWMDRNTWIFQGATDSPWPLPHPVYLEGVHPAAPSGRTQRTRAADKAIRGATIHACIELLVWEPRGPISLRGPVTISYRAYWRLYPGSEHISVLANRNTV